MDVVVRHADLVVDRDQMVDLQKRYLTARSDIGRFEWLYKKNPFGPPRVWVAQESRTCAIIGMAAAFPRSLYIGMKREIGWVLGDFCISEQYRSLGPAIQLQRACLEGLVPNMNTIWYDFPSATMLAIYKRLNATPSHQMIRFVKPLKVDRKVRIWVKSGFLQRCLNVVGNMALNLGNRRVKAPAGLTFHSHEGECGHEFTELSEKIGGSNGNCLERTAAYLNWRYCQNPLYHCVLVTARREDKLKGYVVLTETGSEATILDLFGVHDKDVLLGLLDDIVSRVRSRGCETVDVSIIESHPWIPSFRSVGFRSREASPVIFAGFHVEPKTKTKGAHQATFLLMQGDRDS